jgi:hypothetical protein
VTRNTGAADVRLFWCPRSRIDELQAFIDRDWIPGHILSRDRALLEWQFQHAVEPETLSVAMAESGGRFVGMLGAIRAPFSDRGELRSGFMMANWVAVPAFRESALGLRLFQFVLRSGHQMAGVLGGNATTLRVLRTLRYAVSERVPRWIRPGDPGALERLLASAPASVADAARQSWRSTVTSPGPFPLDSTVAVQCWTPGDAAGWDDCWRRLAPTIRGFARSAGYIDWRYHRHPTFRYETLVARDGDGMVCGLAVFRIAALRGADATVLRIVELLGSPAATDALALTLAGTLARTNAAFADFYSWSPRFAAPLERAGFLREEPRTPLPALFQPVDFEHRPLTGAFGIVDPAAGDSREFFAELDVYITRSDGDQDRPN